MKKLKETLESKKSELDNIIQERNKTYENRSDKWKSSEKGYKHLSQTERLQSSSDNMEESIVFLEFYISES